MSEQRTESVKALYPAPHWVEHKDELQDTLLGDLLRQVAHKGLVPVGAVRGTYRLVRDVDGAFFTAKLSVMVGRPVGIWEQQ